MAAFFVSRRSCHCSTICDLFDGEPKGIENLAQQTSKRLHILLVSDVSISDVIGGAERVLFEQSTRLAQRGHDVHILTRKLPGHRQNEESIQGVSEWRYDVDVKGSISYIRSSRKNSRQLFEYLHGKYNFDCINIHQPFSAIGVVQSPLSRKMKKIYTCLSFSFEEYISRNVGPENFLARPLYLVNVYARKWIEKWILDKCDEIVVLSLFTQDKLWNAHNVTSEKISIIPGGVDLKRFRPFGDKMEIRQRLNIPQDRVVLLTVRNLVQRMGLENLVHSLRIIIDKAPDLFLVLGGSGPLKDSLAALMRQMGLESHIRFTGFISEDELPDYYRMADFFVLPTRELEGFGLVTLEAMASGLPVMGTPIGGTQEILGKFDQHFLFKDSSADAMAALIFESYQRIRENPKIWEEMSLRCQKFVERNYSWEKNVGALENIFDRITG